MRECAQQLLCHWLEADAAGSVPALLQLLDVRQHEEACQRAVRPLTLLHAVMPGHGLSLGLLNGQHWAWDMLEKLKGALL